MNNYIINEQKRNKKLYSTVFIFDDYFVIQSEINLVFNFFSTISKSAELK